MSKNLYIAGIAASSGKSAVSLALMQILTRKIHKIGFFRPIITVDKGDRTHDKDINLIRKYFKMDFDYREMYAFTFHEAEKLITSGRSDQLYEGILDKYRAIEKQCDFVLCEGTDFTSVTSSVELEINARIAYELGSPVMIVSSAVEKNVNEILSHLHVAIDSFQSKNCDIIAAIVNQVRDEDINALKNKLRKEYNRKDKLIYVIPKSIGLLNPTVGEIVKFLNGKVIHGEERLGNIVKNYVVAAGQLPVLFEQIEEGSLMITPGDRLDLILGSLLSHISSSVPKIAGIILTANLIPDETITKIIEGIANLQIPIISVDEETFNITLKASSIKSKISPENKEKVLSALRIFTHNINTDELLDKIEITQSSRITPKMFEYALIEKAMKHKQHIVLPEGEDERILKAAEILLTRNVVNLSLLGNPEKIKQKIITLGYKINEEEINIISPVDYPKYEEYAEKYFELRKHKGGTLQTAQETLEDVTYLGTMMVSEGDADGMVSGAVHTTQDTIRPAFQIIRSRKGFSVVSSVFIMLVKDSVYIYGDCAVNTNPTSEELAEIAVSSAKTAELFDIEPRVAMLSYSTGASGKGKEVDKVKRATEIIREKKPGLKLEGPIQFDAAVDQSVAKTKMGSSEVAGRATVLIFPDLNTGNNTYKAVQRSTGAVAMGPILQGLKKPVNDLSRGCTVSDIINTVVITAIQAQACKDLI